MCFHPELVVESFVAVLDMWFLMQLQLLHFAFLSVLDTLCTLIAMVASLCTRLNVHRAMYYFIQQSVIVNVVTIN